MAKAVFDGWMFGDTGAPVSRQSATKLRKKDMSTMPTIHRPKPLPESLKEIEALVDYCIAHGAQRDVPAARAD